jgi:hypothetical protein
VFFTHVHHHQSSYNDKMKYEITETELKCINILIRALQESINRNAFSTSEVDNIYTTIEKLNKRNVKCVNRHQSLK